MPRAVALLRREHEFLVLAAAALDHGLGDAVQDHEPLETVLHVIARNDEDGGVELGNPDLPTPSQGADLVLACAGIDLEERHPGEMRRQLREQQPLLLHRKRVRRAFVRVTLHLYQGCRVQPGPIILVSPQAGAEVQDSPHDRQVAVDRSRTLASLQLVSNELLQGARVNLLDRQRADIWIQRRQRPGIPLETSLVLVFLQESHRCFSEGAYLASAEEPPCPDLLDPSRKNLYRLPEIACASAFANARSVDVFVDVPGLATQGEAGRLLQSHDFLLSD